jgi:hypothetical protein
MAESAGLRHYPSFETVPEHLQRRIRASAFPPTPDEARAFHLERCIRCLPHDNDTGGFFVAILRKTGPTTATDRRNQREDRDSKPSPPAVADPKATAASSAMAASSPGASNDAEDETREAKRAKWSPDLEPQGDRAGGEGNPDAVAPRSRDKRYLMRDSDGNHIPDLGRDDFVPVGDGTIDGLADFYGLAPTLPRHLLMTRVGGEAKVISYVAPSVKRLLLDAGLQKRVTVVTTGLKVLIRKGQDCEVPYRLSQEGLHFLAPHMSRRKFAVSRQDFEALLSPDVVPFSLLSSDLQSRLAPVTVGSIVIVLDGRGGNGVGGGDGELDPRGKTMLAKWRCRADKVDNLVPKVDLQAIWDNLHALDASAGNTSNAAS